MNTDTSNSNDNGAVNPYVKKQEDKAARYEELAEKNRAEADRLNKKAHDIADSIPLGQPIMVGHHSEAHHRRDLDRIHGAYDKAHEASEKAEYYEKKAANAIDRLETTVSSDDPQAIQKLEAKIKEAEKLHEVMLAVNKLIRSNKLTGGDLIQAIYNTGEGLITMEDAVNLLKPNPFGQIGYPSFRLTNNKGNIKRMKDRLDHLKAHKDDVTTEFTIDGVRVVDNVEENRVQIFYPGTPDEETRKRLKQNGFVYSHMNGCNQRMRGNGMRAALNVLRVACGTCPNLKPYEGGVSGQCFAHGSPITMYKDSTACEKHPVVQGAKTCQ